MRTNINYHIVYYMFWNIITISSTAVHEIAVLMSTFQHSLINNNYYFIEFHHYINVRPNAFTATAVGVCNAGSLVDSWLTLSVQHSPNQLPLTLYYIHIVLAEEISIDNKAIRTIQYNIKYIRRNLGHNINGRYHEVYKRLPMPAHNKLRYRNINYFHRVVLFITIL